MEDKKKAIFQLGGQIYGFQLSDVQTIENHIKYKQVEEKPDNIKGTINLRGQTIPVYSLRRKLKIKDREPNKETRLIVMESNNILIAYEVDKVDRIVEFEDDKIFELPAIISNEDTSYIKEVVNFDGRLIIIMDGDGILTDKEQKDIKAVI